MQYIKTGRYRAFAFFIILLLNPIVSYSAEEEELLNLIQSDTKFQPVDKDSHNDKQPIYVKVVVPEKPAEGLKSFDVATIALAAATVVLTGVGVFVAIVAVWGYKEIREASIRAAIRTARETARKVSAKTAKDVAEAVAARISKSAQPFEGTQQEAEAVIDNLDDHHE